MLEEPTPVNACALLRPPGEVTELPRPVVRPLVWLPAVLLAMPTSPVRCSKPAGPNVTFIGLAALPADTVLFVRFTACAALATFTVPALSPPKVEGVVTPTTLATTDIAGAAEAAVVEARLPLELLVAGENVLAVELHQAGPASSDLSFQLALEARLSGPRPRGLSLQAPSVVAAPQPVVLRADGVAGGGLGLARVQFRADGVVLGDDLAAPFEFMWSSPPVGGYALTAVAWDTAGGVLTSGVENLRVDPPPTGVALVSFGESWRYLDEGTAPAASWRARTGFDDSGWALGAGRLG